MRFLRIWSLAAAEMRSCRRLARTWVFIVIAVLAAVGQWIQLTVVHQFGSSISPSAGMFGPRYLMAAFSSMLVLVFTLGILFLAFDIRSRDIRDRIGEVMDSRAVSNFELVVGRLLGIVLLLSIPCFVVVLLLSGYGVIAEMFNLGFGSAIEPASVLSFLVWDIVPNLMLWGSITIFLAIVLRYRLLVVLVGLALMIAWFFFSVRLPVFVAASLATTSSGTTWPSDLVPVFFSTDILINRASIVVLSIGFLALAAACHPRQVGSRARMTWAGTGVASFVAVALSLGSLVYSKLLDVKKFENWAAVHEQHQLHSATDIQSVRGTVDIRPGNSIHLDLTLTLKSLGGSSDDSWLLSLNPGFRIDELTVNGAASSDHTFEDGLLWIPASRDGSDPEVRIVAQGKPDARFAYLDSKIVLSKGSAWNTQQLGMFGYESIKFSPGYFALLPGASWFPSSGAAYGKTDWDVRARDFFDLDIEVLAPKGWIVAGPGTREPITKQKREGFRFNPTAPVPEFALIGAKFDRRSLVVGGIEFELLMGKKHSKNMEQLVRVVPSLEEWIEERLAILNQSGLEYPYGTLSFVEVPLPLRVYGDGWRMGSVYAQPGIQMFRESGLSLARFDGPISHREAAQTDETQIPKFILAMLRRFFESDYQGGNPLITVGFNLVNYQTTPTGPGATALSYVIDELATKLATEGDGYFSIYEGSTPRGFNQMNNATMIRIGGGGANQSSINFRQMFSDRPSVWEHVLETPLNDIDFHTDPGSAYHALLLKGYPIARSLIDGFGEEAVGNLLRELVSRYSGTTYTAEQFSQTAVDLGMDIESLLGNWLSTTGLPGFVVGESDVVRLESKESGESVYQSTFLIRNDEPVPGVIRIGYEYDSGDKKWNFLDLNKPLRVDASSSIRIAHQSAEPPLVAVIEPYLSLNRDAVRVAFPKLEDYEPKEGETLPFMVDTDWRGPDPDSVIVDDLDDGFAVDKDRIGSKEDEMPPWLRAMIGMPDPEFDRGLPAGDLGRRIGLDFGQGAWLRNYGSGAFGKYRPTYASSYGGPEGASSTFAAMLPHEGTWRLEYHLPWKGKSEYSISGPFFSVSTSQRSEVGQFQIVVNLGDDEESIEFDGDSSKSGWNELGEFDVTDRLVDVTVTTERWSNVIADAVKWTPVSSGE